MKYGLVGVSKTLAAKLGPDGILCNAICPGDIAADRPSAANIRPATGQCLPVEQMNQYASGALRDAGLPKDVASVIANLAGLQANYGRGINLPATGGVPFGI